MPVPQFETYRPSGRFHIPATGIAFGVALLAGLVVGGIYGALEAVNPLIYFTIIGTFFLGIGLGFVDTKLVTFARIRAPWLGVVLALWTAFWGIYGSWMGWMSTFLWQVDEAMFVWDPITLVSLMMLVMEQGAWEIKGHTPTGMELQAIWAIEALIIVGAAVWTAFGQAREPYCEVSGAWYELEHENILLEAMDADSVKRACANGDLTAIAARPITGLDELLVAKLQVGQGPPEVGALTFEKVVITVDKNGKKQEKRTTVVRQMVVRGDLLQKARAMPYEAEQARSQPSELEV